MTDTNTPRKGPRPKDPAGERMRVHNIRCTDAQWADIKTVGLDALRAWATEQARMSRARSKK